MASNFEKKTSPKTHRIRQDIRIPTSLLAELQFDNRRAVFGKIEDLSLSGAKLRLPFRPETGASLTLTIPDRQLSINGTCRWSIREDWPESSFLSGISFDLLNGEAYAQLRQLLFDLAG